VAGYEIYMIFIGLESEALSQARVVQRVEEGGHDVPEDRLVARFPRTLANLRTALRELDCVLLVDNSYADTKYRFVALVEHARIVNDTGERPLWTAGLDLEALN
jgi:predicted ABC-type ATPase